MEFAAARAVLSWLLKRKESFPRFQSYGEKKERPRESGLKSRRQTR